MPPASAVSEFRKQLPINAGTHIITHNGVCTVGAVLKATTPYAALFPGLAAMRYAVTAGHCVSEYTNVSVENQGVIGQVTWVSSVSDLALIKIDPLARNAVTCDPSSTLHRCSIGVFYTPRAIGNIFLLDQAGRYRSIPFRGTAIPGGDEVFCTSGAVTGVVCAWRNSPLPADQPRHRAGASTWVHDPASEGDSGGPVAGAQGQLYGIISEFTNRDYPMSDVMSYVPIDQFFEEQPYYSLAPPG
ncbi:trypsin-like peptidase domain-containing protein [Rathayibacter toxicus]|nr:trypsin-like peptidase domain-containing protein [Rathayibacter toxicus]QOD10165.1 trypsin-like peptidase domain-containing protein [Rathayibacter toxicus]QWL26732.1 serine protease [Rathayibacter toxicus]QWL28841.1 serine protease [Rathayibacter toxicus]QWL30946.1 serine protease [Rathayibacter toxicus]